MTKEQECMKALQCLYLEVPSVIADDIKQKVIDALNEAKNCVIPAVMGELTCDSCGCHPNVIYTTSRGRFCEGCKPAS